MPHRCPLREDPGDAVAAQPVGDRHRIEVGLVHEAGEPLVEVLGVPPVERTLLGEQVLVARGDEHPIEDAIERPRDLRGIEGQDEEPRVADLPSAPTAHEPSELRFAAPSLLGGLLLQGAERPELTLAVDDPLHRIGAERTDELVLEVDVADVEAERLHGVAIEARAEAGPLERPPEVVLLARIAQAREGADPSPRGRSARGHGGCSWPRRSRGSSRPPHRGPRRGMRRASRAPLGRSRPRRSPRPGH